MGHGGVSLYLLVVARLLTPQWIQGYLAQGRSRHSEFFVHPWCAGLVTWAALVRRRRLEGFKGDVQKFLTADDNFLG